MLLLRRHHWSSWAWAILAVSVGEPCFTGLSKPTRCCWVRGGGSFHPASASPSWVQDWPSSTSASMKSRTHGCVWKANANKRLHRSECIDIVIEAIANAWDRENETRLIGLWLDFSPDLGDIDMQAMRSAMRFGSPYLR